MKKSLSVLVASIGFVVVMFSCKKSDSSPSIDGKWYQIEDSSISIVNGISLAPMVTHYNKANYYRNGNSVNFANGVMTDSTYINGVGYAYSGNYSLSGNTITSAADGSQAQVSVSGNTLTLYSSGQDTTWNYSTSPKSITSIATFKDWVIFSK